MELRRLITGVLRNVGSEVGVAILLLIVGMTAFWGWIPLALALGGIVKLFFIPPESGVRAIALSSFVAWFSMDIWIIHQIE